MKKLKSYYLHLRHHQTMELKWIFPLAIGSIVSLFLLFLTTLTSSDSTSLLPFYRSFSISRSIFIKSKPYLIPDSLAASGRHALLLSTNVDPKQRYRLMTLMELGQHHQPIEAWRNNQLSREMNFYRERHCPLSEETPFCLIPFHNGYKIPVPWSDSLTKKTLSLFVHPSMTTIQSIKVRQIFDSCGNPTVEVDIILSNDTLARVVVPSGASTGFYEAFELRDGGKDYLGKGVSKVINNVNIIIDPALIGKDPIQLGKITEEELKQ